MAKIEVTKTELVWPGKYNEDGTAREVPMVSLPFQIIETVSESRAMREAKKSPLQDEGWKNKLIWGDNLPVMGSLLEKFAGKIDLIYIDPPFATGVDFSFRAEIGDGDVEVIKERSIMEEKAYRDTWGRGIDTYLQMMFDRLRIMRDLLTDTGSVYVHLDATVGHYVKLLLDEIFGPESFQREIIWRIGWISGYKSAAANWIRNHDTVFFYVKTPGSFTFNKEYVPYPPGYTRRGGEETTGKGYPIEDVWNATPFEFELKGEASLDSIQIKSLSQEKTGYATQKNESVLRRILSASSNPGGLVADFFCGSGTTLAVAEKLGRRWIGCDISRFAIHTTRKRMLGIEGCKPFEVLGLGKYERRYWQVATFGGRDKDVTEQALYEYLAFTLRLYGAQPVPGLQHLHGKKGRAMVRVGAVDAPVTIDETNAALSECIQIRQPELHVLGWEWETGLHGLMVAEGKKHGIKLVLLQIPREVMERQAVDKGDVRFFELAYLEVEIKKLEKLTVQVALKDFVIPNAELIPEGVRQKVKKWSDYVDYWAVDWDFQNGAFMQGWVTYRTRKDRRLTLTSGMHTYRRPGRYRVLVKVIDIFGNDTSQAFDVEVK